MSAIVDQNQQIAAAVEQQTAVAQDIDQNIVQISQAGERTSEGATQTEQASRELSGSVARLRQLIDVKRADTAAQHPDEREEKLRTIDELENCLDDVMRKRLPYTLKNLAVTGNDLAAIGIPQSPQTGLVLKALLEQVMDGKLSNEKEALLAAALHMI